MHNRQKLSIHELNLGAVLLEGQQLCLHSVCIVHDVYFKYIPIETEPLVRLFSYNTGE